EDGRDTGKLLQLIPPDNRVPSFLLYHYPKGQKEHPLEALGKAIWKPAVRDAKTSKWKTVDGPPRVTTDKGDVQSVTLVAPVIDPDYAGLMIAKTFALAPWEYHIRLQVELIDTRQGQNLKPLPPFRYQLTGAHGMPVEGRWYTSTTRTSMVGLVDAKGNLSSRLTEEARRISVRGGGDRVPENELGQYTIQYAGVVTQFFASMIVVDNTGERA